MTPPTESIDMDPAEATPAQFSFFYPTSWKPSPFLVIPPLFLHVLAATMGGIPVNQFIILTVCEGILRGDGEVRNGTATFGITGTAGYSGFGSYNSTGISSGQVMKGFALPDKEYAWCAARNDVQTRAALWSQMITLASSIPSFLLIPMIGRLADTLGRRSLMILPILSTVIGALSIMVVASTQIGLWLIVAVHVLQGCMGGYATLSLAAYAFIADTSTVEARTRTFLMVDSFSYFAFSIGPFSGGYLYRNFGLFTVFSVVLVFESLVLLYVIFILPESLQLKQTTPSSGSIRSTRSEGRFSLWKTFKRSWVGSLDVLSVPGRGNSLFILASVTAVGSMTLAGYSFVFFFYPAQRFGWDSYDAGLFSLANSSCRLFYLSILLPWLLKKLTVGRNAVGKTRMELTLIRFGISAYALGLTLFGLATSGQTFFGIVFIYAFGTIAMPTARGLVSRMVPSTSQGSLFAALEVLQCGSTLVAQLILPSVFRTTVAWGKSNIICFVLAGGWCMSLLLTAWLKSRELAVLEEEVAVETTPILGDRNGDAPTIARTPSFIKKSGALLGYGAVESDRGRDIEVGGSNSAQSALLQERMALIMGMDEAVEGSVQENLV